VAVFTPALRFPCVEGHLDQELDDRVAFLKALWIGAKP